MSEQDSQEEARSRWYRFRRWLAYRILPDTSEFNVAVARQRAMQELSLNHQNETGHEADQSEEAYQLLKNRIPVRAEWDNSYSFED